MSNTNWAAMSDEGLHARLLAAERVKYEQMRAAPTRFYILGVRTGDYTTSRTDRSSANGPRN